MGIAPDPGNSVCEGLLVAEGNFSNSMGLSFSFVSKGTYPSFLKVWTGISVQLCRERGINKWVGGREWKEGRTNSFRKGGVEIEA